MTNTGRLDVVNGLPDAHAAEQLRACNASPRWIEQVLAHRPYADVDTVLDTAEHVARDLDWSEVRGRSTPTRASASEPGAGAPRRSGRGGSSPPSPPPTPGPRTLLRTGNAAYERRFGHVFLIRAAGRSAEEMVAELDRRLANDEGRERAEVTEQLAQITRLRLQTLLAG